MMISVIIPIYNGENYIDNMINCLLKQRFRDFEVIFIDDGSIDDSNSKIEKYKSSLDLKIVLFKQENKGVSAARNKGIDLTSGSYICFVDVDDDITEDYLSDMHNVLQINNDCELVICKYVQLPSNSDYQKYISENVNRIEIIEKDKALNDFLYGKIISGVCTMMIRRELILSFNIYFAEGYNYSEDLHMVWRLLAYSNRIAYLKKILYVYKQQNGSATSRFNEERLQGFELVKSLEVFFDIHNKRFSGEFREFAAARIMWSILWQAAVYYNMGDFITFSKKFDAKNHMKKLITFKNIKVAISSIIFVISNSSFYYISRFFGRSKFKT